MAIRGILYFYILLVAAISLLSYKKGIFLIWLTFLLTPIMILVSGIKLGLSLMTVLMIISVGSEFRFNDRRRLWKEFLTNNQKAITVYICISLSIVFLSQTVPLKTQLHRLLDEFAIIIFSLQTFMIAKGNRLFSTTLMGIVSGVVIFNLLYCVCFEVILGLNPAGLPLYMYMGNYDDDFFVDAVDAERGALSFRAQTVYGHPLSLGQYMLAFLPLFLINGKWKFKYLYTFIICLLIVLTGTRGAIVPMTIIILMAIKRWLSVPKLCTFILLLFVCVFFIPDRQLDRFNKEVEPYVASFMFWDDSKQKENDIKGSSMEMRFEQFDAANKEIEDNPIFGRGYGYREYWQMEHKGLHPELLGYESLIIYYLVERGWLGLLFFFFFAFYIYKIFRNNTMEIWAVRLVFVGYLLSIIMTGVRPLSLLFVCLSCSIICGLNSKLEGYSINASVDRC